MVLLPRCVAPFATTSSSLGPARRPGGQQIDGRQKFQLASSSASPAHQIWIPPSQQLLQSRATIFQIHNPSDLFNFISEDDRLCVIKVYASWCHTCKKFDLRYRKLASKFGDKYYDSSDVNIDASSTAILGEKCSTILSKRGQVRFAELRYDFPQNEELFDSVLHDVCETVSFPYILMYKRQEGKVRGFGCTPAEFQMLADIMADELSRLTEEELEEEDCVVDYSFQRQVFDLGLMGRR